MIIGIGTDICDIRRIENILEKFGKRFEVKTFTKTEREYCNHKSGPAGYFAKRFAAKEATAKALASKNSGALSWHDVEVINDPSGRPVIHLHGKAEKRLTQWTPKGYTARVHVSLSDDYPFAQALVVIECTPDASREAR